MNEFIVNEDLINVRLDKALTTLLKDKSRTFIDRIIDEGNCYINNKVAKSSYKLRLNDHITIDIPELKELDVVKEDIPLDIVYEDDDILIINKPQGLVVHPAPGHYEHTLVNALLAHCPSLSGINGVKRPGIVHRIDKDTSGLLAVAKNDNAHQSLAEQLKDHSMHRSYYALVRGVINENSGEINLPIARDKYDRKKQAISRENSKNAITYFEVVSRYENHTLVRCDLLTGRTHQIRVHFAYIGHPVEGDKIYNNKKTKLIYDKGQLLVAYKLVLTHPTTHKEMSFEIPLPDYFKEVLKTLE